jgi:hypothetical protein
VPTVSACHSCLTHPLTRIDGMVYSRGAADDFNRYAELTGDEGWSWDQIFPYILKVPAPINMTFSDQLISCRTKN